MDLSKEVKHFLGKMDLNPLKVILDRRGTLALKVLRQGKLAILKMQNSETGDEAAHKTELLKRESVFLSQSPQLTSQLYLDHGVHEGKSWLLLRGVNGIPVSKIANNVREIKGQEDFRVASLLDLLCQISLFFSNLYEAGYLHGDIQPSHIYLEDNEISVIDWGLAQRVDEINSLYKGGFIYYVAPEIAREMELSKDQILYTPYAEVYSLGTTLYRLYTGELALDFGAPDHLLRQVPMKSKFRIVQSNKVKVFSKGETDAHYRIESVLRKSLATNPNDRFNSSCELYDELNRIRE